MELLRYDLSALKADLVGQIKFERPRRDQKPPVAEDLFFTLVTDIDPLHRILFVDLLTYKSIKLY